MSASVKETPSTGGAKFTASVSHVHGKRLVGADPPRYPGVTLGNIGTHFGRQVTWWPQAGAYLDYLARCQHLLQEGVFVADFCLFNGEGAPRLMTPRGLRKVRELARAGAVVCGPLPARSPSLELHPACDGEVETLTRDLAALDLAPDFGCEAEQIASIHRRDGDADVYFVASSAGEVRTVDCAFRVAGKAPELWHPDTGAIEGVEDFRTLGGVTTLPLHLDPSGSVFVVFRKPVEATSARKPKADVGDVRETLELGGSWSVAFQRGRGAPDGVVFEKLIFWTEHADFGVRHFSGTATYRKTFRAEGAGAGGRCVLDLGALADVCTVSLNGGEVGVLWKPPYRLDVTAHLRVGENHLELDVTNRWPNRLVGDAQLPEDAVWKGPRLMEMPAWVKEGRASPAGRIAFATWKLCAADDPLLPSGLFGPVRLHREKKV